MTAEIGDALVIILQNSLHSERVTTDWTTAKIKPLLKKAGKRTAGLYMSVSIKSVIGKMIKSITKEVVEGHLENHKSMLTLLDCIK